MPMVSMLAEGNAFSVTDYLSTIWELGNSAINFVTSNAVTALLLVASLVPIGFGLLRMSKRSARA